VFSSSNHIVDEKTLKEFEDLVNKLEEDQLEAPSFTRMIFNYFCLIGEHKSVKFYAILP